MQSIKATDFNLNHTLECGQAFRWNREGEWWHGVVKGTAVRVRQKDNRLFYETSKKASKDFIASYFRLDDNLKFILASINKDPLVNESIKKFRGLRLVRQEFPECLLSFICSSASNIPRIKRNIEYLSRAFGKPSRFRGRKFYSFPNPEDIAKAKLSEIKACGVGFRAKYLKEAAKSLKRLRARPVPPWQIKQELMEIPGVGAKIADCVMLFSLDRLDAFPVDVWMKRIMGKYYIKGNERELSMFGRANFGRYAGYAQQYLYHHSRTIKLL